MEKENARNIGDSHWREKRSTKLRNNPCDAPREMTNLPPLRSARRRPSGRVATARCRGRTTTTTAAAFVRNPPAAFGFQYLSRNRAHVYLFRHWILSQGPELVAAVAHTWSGADEFRVHEWSGIRHGASGPPIWTVVISVYVPGKATQPGRSTSY
ncbi:hypothetical protein BHE74_00036036 [Ensete ventricosum]|nr:hypothetical protein GW17_00015879 [Ensete ventricosum]RWW57189.1 hypothetical protein BHE74_00036036 [Ensete ventricosum]